MTWRTVKLHDGLIPSLERARHLPDTPAVYSFLIDLDVVGWEEDSSVIRRQVLDLLSLPSALSYQFAPGAFQSIEVESRQDVGNGACYIAEDRFSGLLDRGDFRQLIKELLGAIQELVPALYVGQTKNLQKRVLSHLSGKTGLAKRLARYGLALEKCGLRYYLIKAEDYGRSVFDGQATGSSAEIQLSQYLARVTKKDRETADDPEEYARLVIEELITRLIRPGFVRRVGKQVFGGDDNGV